MIQPLRARRPAIAACAVLAVLVGLELVAILLLNRGQFAYVLDDPYIHLALSDRIAHGHYGINPGEAASPASSILWPFLLAPFAQSSIHALVPLLIGLLAAIGLLVAGGELLARLSVPALPGGEAKATLILLGLIFFLAMPLHVLSGMENMLHVLMTTIAAMGLVVVASERRVPWWFLAALVLSPAIRYEGVSVLIAGAAALWLIGRRGPAVATLAAGLLPVILFGWFLVRQGLPPIPNSVLVKSPVQRGDLLATILSFLRNAQNNFVFDRSGLLVAAMALLCLVKIARDRGGAILALSAGFVTSAYILAGSPGTLGRYWLFVAAFDAVILAHLWRRELVAAAERLSPFRFALALGALVLLLAPLQLKMLVTAPVMANNNWQQQHQLARFLTEFWQRPAALTELGRMSYRNDNYVLDLWGLGSEEARRMRLANEPGWLGRITSSHQVGLALIYDEWFAGMIPADWEKVASLRIERRNKILPSSEMSIYATGPQEAQSIEQALASFAPTLPPGSTLMRNSPQPAAGTLSFDALSSRSK